MYEGIQSEVICTTRFDEKSDLRMTYLGRVDTTRANIITSQVEQWLILSNIVNYVQYDRWPRNFYDLDIKTIDQKSHRKI